MKRFIKILIGGICWGLMFLFLKIVFQISDNVLWQYYLIFSGIMLVGMAAFNLSYNRRYLEKMKTAAQLLDVNRVEEYITEVESMLRRAKGRFANSMLTINLSAGYAKLKQYDKAVELLESVSNVKLSGDFKLVYHLNLCLCYFYQKQTDRAMALYESSQKVFKQYKNNKLYGGNIAILDIYAAIGNKDYSRAAKLLQTARNTWDDPRFLDDYCYLEERIHQTQAD